MSKVIINGKEYTGKDVLVDEQGRVFIDGVHVDDVDDSNFHVKMSKVKDLKLKR